MLLKRYCFFCGKKIFIKLHNSIRFCSIDCRIKHNEETRIRATIIRRNKSVKNRWNL